MKIRGEGRGTRFEGLGALHTHINSITVAQQHHPSHEKQGRDSRDEIRGVGRAAHAYQFDIHRAATPPLVPFPSPLASKTQGRGTRDEIRGVGRATHAYQFDHRRAATPPLVPFPSPLASKTQGRGTRDEIRGVGRAAHAYQFYNRRAATSPRPFSLASRI